jgi:hypothetical protein
MILRKRSFIIILLIIFVIFGPPILIPLLDTDYVGGIYGLRTYIRTYGQLPPNEDDYLQWLQKRDIYPTFLPPFNVQYGTSVRDLEINKGCLMYKKTGEKCCLIYGGRSLWRDIVSGWKYDRASRELFQLMQKGASSGTSKNVSDDPNQDATH